LTLPETVAIIPLIFIPSIPMDVKERSVSSGISRINNLYRVLRGSYKGVGL
jgi:hypothetical protein